MDPELVNDVIAEIRRLWRCSNDIEITLEANPTSSEAKKFQGFAQAGVNRLSMGIQALNNADLKMLGRLHSVEEAQVAFDCARDAFNRVSFDLIYGRQGQSLRDWEKELTIATEMAVDHLSLYQLTIEPETAFGARFEAGKLKGLPSDDLTADMYSLTQDLTQKSGLTCYETSNHARDDCESRHNLIYWRGGDYLGIGPGAHGRLTKIDQRFATETKLEPISWLRQVETTGDGEGSRETISLEDQVSEYVMMAMRLSSGMDIGFLKDAPELEGILNKINVLCDDGYTILMGDHLSITPNYRIVANAVIREILV